jgi:hypothetical protein
MINKVLRIEYHFLGFKTRLFLFTDGSDEEYETVEDVHEEMNTASTSGEVNSEHPPVYIPEDIPIPEQFELRESRVFSGLGVWTRQPIQKGYKMGPFVGTFRSKPDNPKCSWKVGIQQMCTRQFQTIYLSTGVKFTEKKNPRKTLKSAGC